MDNVSRPLIALLVGTVAFFALWITMLKPDGSHSGASQGAGQYQSAINAAKQAVGTSNNASIAHGGTVVSSTAPASPATSASPAAPATPAATRSTPPAKPAVSSATRAGGSAQHRENMVARALASHRVLAILFFNPAAADDRAVKQELASVPTRGSKVVKLAVPLSELSRYGVVTNQVQVNESPTLVLIDGHAQAETITGFADRFEIAQRIDAALAVK